MNAFHAFILGCDIDGWTDQTTVTTQHDWAQSLQNLIRQGVDIILREHGPDASRSCIVVPTGDGAFAAFLDASMIEMPLRLAAQLAASAPNLAYTIGIALHCGVVTHIEDTRQQTNLSGDGVSDTSRLLEHASQWEIVASSAYAHVVRNLDDSFKTLFSVAPLVRADKHGKEHVFHYVKGTFAGVQLGVAAPRPQSMLCPTASQRGFESLKDLESWLSPERRQEVLRGYDRYVRDGRLSEHRTAHRRKLKLAWKTVAPPLTEPAWTSIATTDSAAGYRLVIGFQNKGCDYRREDPLKMGCFHCGFYAGTQPPPKDRLLACLQDQFRAGLAHGVSSGGRFDVIEFLSDGSFLSDDEIPEEIKKRIFQAIRQMPHVRRVLVESVPRRVFDERAEVGQRLAGLRPDQELEIGIGLETADEFIRQVCLNKVSLRQDCVTRGRPNS